MGDVEVKIPIKIQNASVCETIQMNDMHPSVTSGRRTPNRNSRIEEEIEASAPSGSIVHTPVKEENLINLTTPKKGSPGTVGLTELAESRVGQKKKQTQLFPDPPTIPLPVLPKEYKTTSAILESVEEEAEKFSNRYIFFNYLL